MTPFDYQGRTLRHIEIAGEPWFIAADACRCLGLSMHAGVTHHLYGLKPAEKRAVRRMTPTSTRIPHNTLVISEGVGFEWNKAEARATAISESGLYKLIMRARPTRPDVAAFQNWVTEVVLPSIRKTGGYQMAPGETMPVPEGMAADCHALLS